MKKKPSNTDEKNLMFLNKTLSDIDEDIVDEALNWPFSAVTPASSKKPGRKTALITVAAAVFLLLIIPVALTPLISRTAMKSNYEGLRIADDKNIKSYSSISNYDEPAYGGEYDLEEEQINHISSSGLINCGTPSIVVIYEGEYRFKYTTEEVVKSILASQKDSALSKNYLSVTQVFLCDGNGSVINPLAVNQSADSANNIDSVPVKEPSIYTKEIIDEVLSSYDGVLNSPTN